MDPKQLLRSIGRPPRLNPAGKEFRDLYLDPLLEPADICKQLGISLRTFYNYVEQSGIPTLRVILPTSSGLPRHKALYSFSHHIEIYDAAIAWMLGTLSGIRFKLLPVEYGVSHGLLKNARADMAIHITRTPDLAHQFYFSENYKFHGPPLGRIYKFANSQPSSVKPRLGACAVHAEFAAKMLSQEYTVKSSATFASLFKSWTEGSLDMVLVHPDALLMKDWPSEAVETISKPLHYRNTYTAIAFHSESEQWRSAINKALEQMDEARLFKTLEDFSFGRPVAYQNLRGHQDTLLRCVASISSRIHRV